MRKNVASQTVGAQMITAADGSAFTSAVTIHVTGDGGTQATGSVGSGACTHEGNGYHSYAPAQAETNYDHVAFTFTGTGAIPATVQIYTTFPQTGDNYARLGAPAGASVSADIAAVNAKTTNLPSDPADASVIAGRFDTLDTSVADLPTNAELTTALGTSDDAVLARLGTPAGASVSADIAAVKAQTAAIETDTQDIQARLPAALVSGRIDASVGAMAAGVVTAAAIATDAIDSDAIAASAVTEIQSGLATAAAVAALPTAATNADAVWDEDATAHQTQGTFGQAIGDPVADTNTIYKAVVTDATAATVGLDVVDLKTQIGTAGAGLTAADDAVMTRLGTPAGASVSVDIAAVKTQTAAIEADTQDIQSRLPAALVSGRIDASVGAMAAGVVTAAAIATDAIDSDAIAASAVTEIQSGLATAAALTVVDDLIDTEVGAIKTVTDKLDTAMELDGAVYRFTTNALEQAPTGGSAPTAAAIADAVWDEAISGHLTAGTTGAALNAAGSAGDPWTTPLPGAYGSGTAGKIIGDNVNATISSRATQTSVDTVDTVVDAIKLKTDNLPTDPADASVVAGLIAGVETKVDTVDTVVDAIKLKTDNLPSDPADASVIAGRFDTLDTSVADLPTNAELATSQAAADDATLAAIATLQTSVNDLPTNAELATALGTADDATLAAIAALQSVVDAILVDTGTTLDTKINTIDTVVDAIKAKTDSLTFTVAGQVDANVQAINDTALVGDGDSVPWGPA